MRRVRKLILGHTESLKKARPALQNQVFTVLRIWRNYHHDDIGLERLIRLFLALSQFLSIGLYIKQFTGRWGVQVRKLSTEVYVLCKMLLPVCLFHWEMQSELWAALVISYLLCETVIYLGGLVFLQDVSHDRVAPKRSLTLLFLNFFEIVLDFGLLYAYLCSVNPGMFNQEIIAARDAIYFSFVTAATLGYGDIYPVASAARELVIVQITLTFVFVGLFINYFSSMLQRAAPAESSQPTFRKTRHRKKS